MLLRQMKYFLAVADCRSFSEAAEQCYISQSAISQQIKVLEDELGTELIRRSNRRFQLTQAGEFFYNRSKSIVQDTEQLKDQLKELEQPHTLRLRLACRTGWSMEHAAQAMNAFLAAHPRTHIIYSEGTHDELMEQLHRGEVDFVITSARQPSELADYAHLPLGQETWRLFVSQRSQFAKRSSLELKELADLPCIVLAEPRQAEQEQIYLRRLLHMQGACTPASDLAATLSVLANNAGTLPLACRADLANYLGKFASVLPIERDQKPLLEEYALFYNPTAIQEKMLQAGKELQALLTQA